jgi:hypothetical protein
MFINDIDMRLQLIKIHILYLDVFVLNGNKL